MNGIRKLSSGEYLVSQRERNRILYAVLLKQKGRYLRHRRINIASFIITMIICLFIILSPIWNGFTYARILLFLTFAIAEFFGEAYMFATEISQALITHGSDLQNVCTILFVVAAQSFPAALGISAYGERFTFCASAIIAAVYTRLALRLPTAKELLNIKRFELFFHQTKGMKSFVTKNGYLYGSKNTKDDIVVRIS